MYLYLVLIIKLILLIHVLEDSFLSHKLSYNLVLKSLSSLEYSIMSSFKDNNTIWNTTKLELLIIIYDSVIWRNKCYWKLCFHFKWFLLCFASNGVLNSHFIAQWFIETSSIRNIFDLLSANQLKEILKMQ